jgi:hypothetical protein
MKNVYDGMVTTNGSGDATITLPAYVEALNRDFRYQLTVVGTDARAYVSREVSGNRFAIKSDRPSVRVSWQLTGVRKDAYAARHGLVVEEAKTGADRGRYLHPEEHDQPADMAVALHQPGIGAAFEKAVETPERLAGPSAGIE